MPQRHAVYPGTFDPITVGHVDVVYRALKLFDQVTVAIATGGGKTPLFTKNQRLEMVQRVFEHMNQVSVVVFDHLLVDCVETLNADVIVRGLRAVSDFEYEFQMASMNRKLSESIETVFLTPSEPYTCLSSTMVRQIAQIDLPRVEPFVPPTVFDALKCQVNGNAIDQ